MPTLTTFGDSITQGYYASTVPKQYASLIASAKGLTLNNLGLSGRRLNDPAMIDNMYAETVAGGVYTAMVGVNDDLLTGYSVGYIDQFRGNLAAGMAWLAIPDAYKIRPSATTRTGTWSANTIFGGMDYLSSTNGSTMTTKVNGTSVYIAHTRNTNTGTFTVTIDGVVKGTYSTYCATIPTRQDGDHGIYGTYLLRFTNLNPGDHTVVITVTSSTGSPNFVFIDWIGSNGFPKTNQSSVYLGNCWGATDALYVSNPPASAAGVSGYNAAIAEVAYSLAFDGLNVHHVDVNKIQDRVNDMYDDLHPNDTGHQKIADAFVTAMDSAPVIANTPWFVPVLQNSWVPFSPSGTGFDSPSYMKDATGIVHLKGLAKSGTVSPTAPVFTLPVGFRPPLMKHIPIISNGALGILEIRQDGTVNIAVGSSSYVSLDYITFVAEQ